MTVLRTSWRVAALIAITSLGLVGRAAQVAAVEVGEPAPGFTLPATTGRDISLTEFRGKSWVLLEFYGADFAPT